MPEGIIPFICWIADFTDEIESVSWTSKVIVLPVNGWTNIWALRAGVENDKMNRIDISTFFIKNIYLLFWD